MKNNKGATGEGIFMIYRVLLVAFIAFVILGLSSIFYSYYIDVRDVEAKIMAREVINCLSPDGVLNLDKFSEEDRAHVLSYCGFDASDSERFFVRVKVLDSRRGEVYSFYQGDSGSLWIRDFFEKTRLKDESIAKYWPGYFSAEYPSYFLKDSSKAEGVLKLEVLVKDEF